MHDSYPEIKAFVLMTHTIELNDMVRVMDKECLFDRGLRKLALKYLHVNLTKAQQMSNWERPILSPAQIHYAAANALVCIHIYDVIKQELIEFCGEAYTETYLSLFRDFDCSVKNGSFKCPTCKKKYKVESNLEHHLRLGCKGPQKKNKGKSPAKKKNEDKDKNFHKDDNCNNNDHSPSRQKPYRLSKT